MVNNLILYLSVKSDERSHGWLDLIGTLRVGASTRRFSGGWLLLGGLQIDHSLTRTFCLISGHLCGTATYGIELRPGAQVLEVLTRREDDVYIDDVVRGELLDVFRTLAAQRDTECPQFTKLHLVPTEQLFHETLTSVRYHALNRTSGENPVMVCDMLNELGERHHLIHLRFGVSLLWRIWLDGIPQHENTVIDHTINSFKELNIKDLSPVDNAKVCFRAA